LPPFAAKQMGWQLCSGSQTEELRPGRPDGLPRTAAIKTEHRQSCSAVFWRLWI